MHLESNAKSSITSFSTQSWERFVLCSRQWVNLNTTESVLAEKAILTFNINADQDVPAVPPNVGYHRECYMRFTHKGHIERAQKRKEKADNNNEGLYKMIQAILNIINCMHTATISKFMKTFIWSKKRISTVQSFIQSYNHTANCK